MTDETSVGRHGAYESRPIHVHRDSRGLIQRIEIQNLRQHWAIRESAPDPMVDEYTDNDMIGPSGNTIISIREDECWAQYNDGSCYRCLEFSSDNNIVLASIVKFDKFGLVIPPQWMEF
jgi:hypothetical protein